MKIIMLFLGLLIATLSVPGAESIGVCYGLFGDNLPSPQDVVALYKQQNIAKMRIYGPDERILQALRGSNIELMLGVATETLESLASDQAAATNWVQTNVRNYLPDVQIKYIVVANEVSPKANSRYVPSVLPALRKVYSAIVAAGLQNQVKVTVAFDTKITENTFPPSDGVFSADVISYMRPIIDFLVSTNAPILVNVYPYFAYASDPQISTEYALFTNPSPAFTDPNTNLGYQNLFDAILDGFYAALNKAGGASLEIVVAESGWPSGGGDADETNEANAGTYHRNLIKHVKGGSPMRPGKLIETYMFAMFDENQKGPEQTEKFFGLFLPNKQSKYQLSFS